MNTNTSARQDGETNDGALTALRQEVVSLRHQGAIMLRLLSSMLGTLKEIRSQEDVIEHDIDVVEREIEQILGQDGNSARCPSCGGPFDHHSASGGDLRICPACGLSQFVDAAGVVRHTTLPSVLPPDDIPPSASWVE